MDHLRPSEQNFEQSPEPALLVHVRRRHFCCGCNSLAAAEVAEGSTGDADLVGELSGLSSVMDVPCIRTKHWTLRYFLRFIPLRDGVRSAETLRTASCHSHDLEPIAPAITPPPYARRDNECQSSCPNTSRRPASVRPKSRASSRRRKSEKENCRRWRRTPCAGLRITDIGSNTA